MIKIFTTGGTIDKIYFDAKSEFTVGKPLIDELLSEANITFSYEVESILSKDSLDMTEADRRLIRGRIENDANKKILITHGTDTMTETATFLADIKDKTIVFTGSMQPARLRSSDAIFNIGYAIAVLQLMGPGVYIAMNGCLFDPRSTRKNVEKHQFEAL